jgi:hypothetical protein
VCGLEALCHRTRGYFLRNTNLVYTGLHRLVGKSNTKARTRMSREDPLNLSILLSGGKETNKDSPSNGE